MSGNASNDTKELGQCAELIGSVAKAMALVAPKMTTQARQSWIGLPPAEFAGVLGKMIFLPANHNPSNLVIDCDAAPFIPEGWTVDKHEKGGQVQWEPSKVSLWLASGQQNGGWLWSHDWLGGGFLGGDPAAVPAS
jgi:hypothetical protein